MQKCVQWFQQNTQFTYNCCKLVDIMKITSAKSLYIYIANKMRCSLHLYKFSMRPKKTCNRVNITSCCNIFYSWTPPAL